MNIFLERLARLVRSRNPNYGQEEIEKGTGISQSTISRYLDPKRNAKPGYEELRKLADFFQVPPGYFFETRKEPMVIREGPDERLLEDAIGAAEEIRARAVELQSKLRKMKQ